MRANLPTLYLSLSLSLLPPPPIIYVSLSLYRALVVRFLLISTRSGKRKAMKQTAEEEQKQQGKMEQDK